MTSAPLMFGQKLVKNMASQYLSNLSKRSLWLWWVVTNLTGAVIGAQLAVLAGVKNISHYPDLLIFAGCTGFSVSLFQAIVLYHRFLPQQRIMLFWGWVCMSGISSLVLIAFAPLIMFLQFLISSLLPIYLVEIPSQQTPVLQISAYFLLFGLLGGAVTGITQHILLPNFQGNKARQWILFSSVAASLGLGIAAFAVTLMFQQPIFLFENISGTNTTLTMTGMTLFNLIAATINSGITGVQIVRIFRF